MSYLLKLYSIFNSCNFNHYKKIPMIKIPANIIAKVIQWIFCQYLYRKKLKIRHKLSENNDVIVSLTTFPKRFSYLKYTLYSILKQTVIPDKIIVNLIKSECPNELEDIPKDLLDFQEYGVKFIFREENLKPHNKYFYTFQDYPESIIITIDDDLYYRPTLIEKLLDLHKKNPTAVCADLVRKITLTNNSFTNYSYWDIYNENSIGHNYLALGFGGVLYPAKLFNKTSLLDKDIIKKICLNADDLWLKAKEITMNIPVVTGKFEGPTIDLDTSRINALSSSNVAKNSNDVQWESLNKQFKLSHFFKENKDYL